ARRRSVDPECGHRVDRRGIEPVAGYIDKVLVVRIDRDREVDGPLIETGTAEGWLREMGPGPARISRPKKPGHLAVADPQVDDADGDGSAGPGGNLEDCLRARLDRVGAVRRVEHFGPGPALIVADVKCGGGIMGGVLPAD